MRYNNCSYGLIAVRVKFNETDYLAKITPIIFIFGVFLCLKCVTFILYTKKKGYEMKETRGRKRIKKQLLETVTLRVEKDIKQVLSTIDNKQEFMRQAINEKMQRENITA